MVRVNFGVMKVHARRTVCSPRHGELPQRQVDAQRRRSGRTARGRQSIRCARLPHEGYPDPHRTPVAVDKGDAILLQNALHNVLDNAIKYSPAESTFTFTLENRGAQAGIRVCDQGPASNGRRHRTLTQRFRRGGNIGKRRRIGAGALTIANEVVHAQWWASRNDRQRRMDPGILRHTSLVIALSAALLALATLAAGLEVKSAAFFRPGCDDGSQLRPDRHRRNCAFFAPLIESFQESIRDIAIDYNDGEQRRDHPRA